MKSKKIVGGILFDKKGTAKDFHSPATSATLFLMLSRILFLLLLLSATSRAEPISFNRDVLPILSDKCFHCHGPDSAKRKAGLRFDREADAKKKSDGHAAIVDGKPAESELIRRIFSKDAEEKMPPAKSGRDLTPAQAEMLRKWIAEGAKWEKHWAFAPPTRPPLPTVKDPSWPHGAIDAHILARLEKAGLRPSPQTDRATLIRRMSFDLTGLPPAPAEVDAFVRDASPDAVEKLADRLLASPRYGERMAWRWLEAARYADTNGYQTDAERDMWRWRDWVIEAYNRNLPFDQFTIEQLAGDMLPKPTLDQRIATGFNRNHRGNAEGGIVPEEYAAEYVADRVETTSTVWLGLTLGCARCHDHKYDPFTQREFYQLFAFFNNVPEKGRAVKYGNSPPYIQAPTAEQRKQYAILEQRVRDAARKVEDTRPVADAAFSKWKKTAKGTAIPDWIPQLDLVASFPFNDASKLAVRDGDTILGAGHSGKGLDLDGKRFADAGNVADFGFDDRFSFSFWVRPRSENGTLISRMAEEERADGYSMRLVNGKIRVHLTKRWLDDALRLETIEALKLNEWQHVVVSYDASRLAEGVRVYVNGNRARTNTLLDELNQTFQTKEPLRIGSGGGKATRFDGQIDELYVYSRVVDGPEARVLAVAASIRELLAKPEAELKLPEDDKLLGYFLDREAPTEVRAGSTALIEARLAQEKFQRSVPTVMVMEEMAKPRESHVLLRGQYDRPGDKVNAALPAEIASKLQAGNRLDLAKWLVSPENPLTARVAVNRIWQMHFGTGLVKTGEDFGTQGDFPSHPQLLDWLAMEFIRSGWDVKGMHRLIVTSAVYRQSSQIRGKESGVRSSDPENRLLSRFPRQRLSAEMIRDQALFASGLLVEREGGPSVKPYQPAGLWNELSGVGDYEQDTGENLYRRGLYTYWKRTSPPPGLAAFDAFARETCWVRETRTNTPLQALTLLNDITYVEASRKIAEQCMKEETAAEARLSLAFRRVLSRGPTEAEAGVLLRAFNRQLDGFRKNPEAARKLLAVGEAKADAKLEVAELAAYSAVCRLILNLDEAVTRE